MWFRIFIYLHFARRTFLIHYLYYDKSGTLCIQLLILCIMHAHLIRILFTNQKLPQGYSPEIFYRSHHIGNPRFPFMINVSNWSKNLLHIKSRDQEVSANFYVFNKCKKSVFSWFPIEFQISMFMHMYGGTNTLILFRLWDSETQCVRKGSRVYCPWPSQVEFINPRA